jgi:hypothetical protein
MDEELRKFCHKYEAYVTPSSRMQRRLSRPTITSWSELSYQEEYQSFPVEDIPCVEIHMPEDRLRALVENKNWVNGYEEHYHRSGLSILIDQHDEETRLRHQHPGVMDAWLQYQTMLNLVR